jgi:hypothetical protein
MPRTKRDAYPTWQRFSSTLWRSEEERDGEPDFRIERHGRQYWVSWRTSAHWSGPFPSLAAAKHSTDPERGVR